MRFSKTLSIMALSGLSLNSFAGDDYFIKDDLTIPWTKVITISGGPGWTNSEGTTQGILLVSGALTNTYVARKNSNTVGFGEVFFALQNDFVNGILGQWGVALSGAGDADLVGDVYVNDVYSGSQYSYHVNHAAVSLRGKLILDPKIFFIQPYLTASVGAAFNHGFDYLTTPPVNTAVSPRYYDQSTIVGITYSVGGGLQLALNKNWQIGMGYEFADWGRNSLGGAPNTSWTINHGPRLSHIYVNQTFVSLSYLC